MPFLLASQGPKALPGLSMALRGCGLWPHCLPGLRPWLRLSRCPHPRSWAEAWVYNGSDGGDRGQSEGHENILRNQYRGERNECENPQQREARSISHHSPGQLFFHPSAGLMWAQVARVEAAGHVGHSIAGGRREGMQEPLLL